MITRLPSLCSSDFTFAAEVVKVVGSPCLKEAHLSDVVHSIPYNPRAKEDTSSQNNKIGTESNEGMVVSIPMNSVLFQMTCVLVGGKHKVPSCFWQIWIQ